MLSISLVFQAILAVTTFALPSIPSLTSPTVGTPVGSNPAQTPLPHFLFTGASHHDPKETFEFVTATIVIPTIKELPDDQFGEIDIWIGMDNDGTCLTATLTTGVRIFNDKGVKYSPFAAQAHLDTLENLNINPNDKVTFSIVASAPTKAKISIVNHSTGDSVVETFVLDNPLCRNTVMWMVSGMINELQLPVPDFGVIDFQDAIAEAVSGPSGPAASDTTYVLQRNDTILTDLVLKRGEMIVKRINVN